MTFTPKAFDLVHALSGGVPRMINLLCDRSLMVACEKQTSRIAEEHVVHAAGQLGQEIPKGKIKGEREEGAPVPSRRPLVIAAVLVLILLAAAVFALIGDPLEFLSRSHAVAATRRATTLAAARLTPLPAPAGMPVTLRRRRCRIVFGPDRHLRLRRQVELVERALSLQQGAGYMIDVLMAPDDLQRRVLVGRYATREEAENVRAQLGRR